MPLWKSASPTSASSLACLSAWAITHTTPRAMTIACHRYHLHASAPIGARSQSAVRRGALLRFKGTAGGFGYADLHPWPELGDLDLEAQLAALARGECTDLSRASLAFAALDGKARAEGRSLWERVAVPPSHFLVPGGAGGGAACVEGALAEGFTRFKVKIGKDLNAESRVLRDMAAILQRAPPPNGTPPLLRLDCNEVLARADFAACLAALPFVLPLIDFVEDPFPFEALAWTETSRRLGVSFAADRAVMNSAGFDGPQILKPARFGPQVPAFFSAVRDRRRRIVTSYLDHPLGQLGAAWVAAQLGAEAGGETHGLVSHRVYAPNAFSERLGWCGPHLTLPPGLGFGFDDLLSALDWTPLC